MKTIVDCLFEDLVGFPNVADFIIKKVLNGTIEFGRDCLRFIRNLKIKT